MPEGNVEALNLYCYVGIPDPKGSGSSSGQNYGTRTLAVGDEVTIRVIETEVPDRPLPPSNSDPGFNIASVSGDGESE